MKKLFALVCVALMSFGAASSVSALQVYDFSFQSVVGTPPNQFIFGSGELTTTSGGSVSSISGNVFDAAYIPNLSTFPVFTITGLSPYASADNIIYGNAGFVSYAGLSFTTSGVGGSYNVFNKGTGSAPDWAILDSTFSPQGDVGAAPGTRGIVFSVTAVPEPETYAMMLAGLGLMAAIARRRKQKNSDRLIEANQ
jgi:hypothetical protein